MMTQELSEAIGRHRNDRVFHDVVRTMQNWVKAGLIDLKGLKEAILLLEYDEEIKKGGRE